MQTRAKPAAIALGVSVRRFRWKKCVTAASIRTFSFAILVGHTE